MKNSALPDLAQNIEIIPDGPHFDKEVERLCTQSFGPGRFAKAASLLRENNVCKYSLSRAIASPDGDGIIAACRIYGIIDDNGKDALFLGPIVVDKEFQGNGIGAMLLGSVIAACDNIDHSAIILVGDLPFFGQFGFTKVPEGQLILPASTNSNRLLWRVQKSALAQDLPFGKLRRPL